MTQEQQLTQYSDVLRAGLPGFHSRQRGYFYLLHPASYTVGIRDVSPGVTRQDCRANYSPPSGANAAIHSVLFTTSWRGTLLIKLSENFTFTFQYYWGQFMFTFG
jgi:hypothetical protein